MVYKQPRIYPHKIYERRFCLLLNIDVKLRKGYFICRVILVPKNKPCKRNNRQISDNTKIAAKQGNAEERPDAGCEIKRWKAAAEMSSVFNIPPDISKADKPQGFGDRVPDSR